MHIMQKQNYGESLIIMLLNKYIMKAQTAEIISITEAEPNLSDA